MNCIKNKLIVLLNNQIIAYNPIRDVCRILGESCLVLSSNMDQMIKDGNVTFERRIKYHAIFVIHLLVAIKYAILVIYDDPNTIAMFGESFHVLTNIYYCSRLCLSFQIAIVPIKFTLLYFDDQLVANILMTISRFQTSLPFNRINNRKVTAKIWLMSKLFTKFSLPLRWIILPATMLYCSTLAYTNSPIRVNPVTLAIHFIIQCVWLINLIEIGFFGGVFFFLTMSMALLRYKELIHMIRVRQGRWFSEGQPSIQSVGYRRKDVSSSNRSNNQYYIPNRSISYRFVVSTRSRWLLVNKISGCHWFLNCLYF